MIFDVSPRICFLNFDESKEVDMVLKPVLCPSCLGTEVVKHGKSPEGKQRYLCQCQFCSCQTFILDYSDKGRLAETKQRIIEMALNGSGVRDTSSVLGTSTTTVIKPPLL